uniref:CTLH domain-containing protein n=1 Tax=Glycine max TaxID=3847 RepID=K7KXZ7_SOYBN
MNKLVMNFLITEGYVEAAEKFRMESGTEPDIDLATITYRMAVKNGSTKDTGYNSPIIFHLQQQRLIELFRNGKVEALEFA